MLYVIVFIMIICVFISLFFKNIDLTLGLLVSTLVLFLITIGVDGVIAENNTQNTKIISKEIEDYKFINDGYELKLKVYYKETESIIQTDLYDLDYTNNVNIVGVDKNKIVIEISKSVDNFWVGKIGGELINVTLY